MNSHFEWWNQFVLFGAKNAHQKTQNWLVVSNMNFIVHFIYGIILPIDELIFFKMVKTTNQEI